MRPLTRAQHRLLGLLSLARSGGVAVVLLGPGQYRSLESLIDAGLAAVREDRAVLTEHGMTVLRDLIVHAESEAARHLGNANEHAEQDRPVSADLAYDQAQRWLDRANDLRGQGS